MTGIVEDIRYATRGLTRNPGFTAIAVLTLALGSGANAAIFSIFNQALVRALPVPAPEQLVNLSSPGPKPGRTWTSGTARASDVFSYPLFRDLERAQNTFTGIAAHRDFAANIGYRGQATSEEGRLVSGNYFQVLGLRPAVGRLLTPEDDFAVGTHHVAVLSYRYWISRFSGNATAVNDNIVVNGQSMTIVGVTPSNYFGTTLEDSPEIYVPLSMARLMMPGLRNPHAGGGPWNGFDDRRDHWLYLFARLKPGISREAAEQTINGPFGMIIRGVEFPAQRSGMGDAAREQFRNRRLFLEPGKQGQRPERGELSHVFLLLFCVTGVVLLIACANIASLLLARAAYRTTDFTVRLSLGASRQQLVRHLMVESCLLAMAGTVGGLLLATWILGAVTSVFPAQAGGYFRFEFDSTLFLFTAGLSGGIALLIGLYPALHGTRRDLVSTLKGGTTPAGTRSAARFRSSLATTQIALSMALLVVAGLFAKSLLNVGRVELGITPENLTTFRLSPELNGYTPERARVVAERVEQELLALPGVQSVSASTIPLLAGMGETGNITVDAFGNRMASERSASRANIGPDYFRTVGIPLVAGREFSLSDDVGAPNVAIVNEAFARTFTSGRNPIGLRMAEGAGDKIELDIEIVGLVRDARYSQIKDAPPPQYFLPYRQSDRFGRLNFYVRSTQPAEQLVLTIPVAVRRVDGTLPVENLRTMADQLRSTLGLDRFVTLLSAGFAGLATLLSAIGLYGVLSFTVAQRRREIGVRMALGADPGRIGRLILTRVGHMTAVGAVIGILAALALSQLARSLLFGIEGQQPLMLAGAAACTALIALAAGAIPARRAARVDPLVALRYE